MGQANFWARTLLLEEHIVVPSHLQSERNDGKEKRYLPPYLESCIKTTPVKDSYTPMLACVLYQLSY